jgi:hypothetical protein
MPGPRLRLTPQLVNDLCYRIKAGAFEQVAAESLGVPFDVYRGWLTRGRRAQTSSVYRQLFRGVQQARAHARLMAEMELRKAAPKVWLLHGPGRETTNLPGWTAPARARLDHTSERLDVFRHPQIVALLRAITAALAPFPEARAAVLRVLEAQM